MAGEKTGKETRGAQLKRLESLETELGVLYDRLESQDNRIQQQADSLVFIHEKMDQNQSKMDQRFEEVLGAITKIQRNLNTTGKGAMGEETTNIPVLTTEETPRSYIGTSRHDTGGSRNGNSGGEGSNWRYRKLDMPLFDGENPDGRILRTERYFNFYRLSEGDKMEAAIVARKADALLWFQ